MGRQAGKQPNKMNTQKKRPEKAFVKRVFKKLKHINCFPLT
jgi:hypothetical protein